MKNSRFNIFSTASLAAIGFSASVSFAPRAKAGDTAFSTTQTVATVLGDVGGPNTVTKTGAATTLTLTAANLFSGGLFIKEGTVKGNTNNSTVFGTGIIYLGDSSGSSNATLQTNSASGGATYANPISVVAGNTGTATINGLSSSAGTDTFSGAITLNTHDLTLSQGSAYGLKFSGGVTGTGNLTLASNGGGALTLQTAAVNNIGTITHASTGGSATVISGGVGANVTTIHQNSTVGLTIQTTALTVNIAGTTLNSSSTGGFSVTSAVAGTGNLVVNANSTGVIGLAAVNNVGTITNSGTSSGTVTISGVIGTNVTGLTQNSATSILSLTGTNTYAGVFTLGTGTVSVGSVGNGLVSGNLGAASNAASNLIFDGGTLAITGSGSSDRAFTINAGKTANINVAGSQSFAGATGAATNGALVKLGAGTLTLTGASTFTGGLTIKAGTMQGNTNAAAFGNGTITLGDSTGSSNVTLTTNAASGLIYANPITVAGGNTGVATITSINQGGFSGAITLSSHDLTVSSQTAWGLAFSGGVTGTGNLTINSTSGGGNTTFSTAAVNNTGTITHNSTAGLGGVISSGVGANVTAINQNSATIGLTIQTNALTVNSAGTTLNSGNAAAFSVTSAVAGTGNLILKANSNGVIGLSAVNNVGTITNSGTSTGAVTISGVIGTNVTGVTQNSATSILTLSGINTYTGPTLITAGTLKLDATGTINNTSEVSLGTVGTFDVTAKSLGYTVATLKGSGNVTGALTVSTQLAIGNSPGTTNFSSNLTLGAGSTYLYDLTGGVVPGSADLGDIAGALTITAGSILDLVQLGTYTANNKFTLFAYDGALTGTFKDTASNNLADGATFTDAGGSWMIDYNDTSAGANGGVSASNTYVTITAVPEPNAAALLGGLGFLALLRRRR